MTPLIIIGGGVGVGKTTLAHHLQALGAFALALESQVDRPFQARFAADHQRYALANQIDFLLRRAEQEQALRTGRLPGLQDGGLDVDFHIFTRYFHELGYLNPAEYDLCQRLYNHLRAALPPPELVLFLRAPLPVVKHRYQIRGRALEIAQLADLDRLNDLASAWRADLPDARVLDIDASHDDFLAPTALAALAQTIQQRLARQPS